MANYSPQHFEPRAKAVNVKGVANRAVATVLTAGLIAQPLMSPLAAIAAPSTDNGDSVQGGGSSVENTVAAGNQAVVKTAAQLAEESAKQLKDAQAAYDAAQKKADAAGQSQKQAQQQKNQASQAVSDNEIEQNAAEVAALQEKIDELKAAVEKTEQQQKKLGDLNDQLDQANKSVEDKTQALKDAKAKQDEAKKALDDAQAKLEAMGMDEYEAAKKAVEDAQTKLDDANKAVTTAQANLDQAKAAEASAQQEKQNTEAALTTAQAKKQETAAALAAATPARDNAQQKFNQAQAALDAAVQVVPVVQEAQRHRGPLRDVERRDRLPRLEEPEKVERAVQGAGLGLRRDDHGRVAADARRADDVALAARPGQARVPPEIGNGLQRRRCSSHDRAIGGDGGCQRDILAEQAPEPALQLGRDDPAGGGCRRGDNRRRRPGVRTPQRGILGERVTQPEVAAGVGAGRRSGCRRHHGEHGKESGESRQTAQWRAHGSRPEQT